MWEVGHRLGTLENKSLFIQGFFNEMFDFCEAVLESRPLRTCGLDFALHLMQVYEAALIRGGETITIPE